MSSKRTAEFLVIFFGFSFFFQTGIAEAATDFANPTFQNSWQYSDKLVDEIPEAGRSYTWGPNSFAITREAYQDAPTGQRLVQYFDKSRMELSASGVSITNGLLTKELVSGQRQYGDNKFTGLEPSTLFVVGDPNAPDSRYPAPTYASFKNVVSLVPGQNVTPDRTGQFADLIINRAGEVKRLDNPRFQVRLGQYEPVLGHNIPQAFVDFIYQSGRVWDGTKYVNGPIYTDNPIANVFGYPISEPYWSVANVNGDVRSVLVQLFERRVLTYNGLNADPFKVEMGNVGQHYYNWRYGNHPPPTLDYQPAICNNKPLIGTQALAVSFEILNPTASTGTQTICIAANHAGKPLAGAVTRMNIYYPGVVIIGSRYAPNTGPDGKAYFSWNIDEDLARGNKASLKGKEIKLVYFVSYANLPSVENIMISWVAQ